MASRYSGAGQGALAGAQLGSVGGLTGSAIGAGIGALGGLAFGGESSTEAERRKRLQELQRRQELGTLGFTDAEINTRLGAAQGQAQQQMQADRQQQAALLGAQDLGAGSFAKRQQAQAQREQTVMAQLANQVQQENMQRAAQQEAELAALEGTQLQQEALYRQQALEGALGAGGTIMDMKDRSGRAESIKEQIEALSQLDLTEDQMDDAIQVLGNNFGSYS